MSKMKIIDVNLDYLYKVCVKEENLSKYYDLNSQIMQNMDLTVDQKQKLMREQESLEIVIPF